MPRVIIVSPHFPPVSAADHQRVRMALPHLLELGWEVDVIAVHPDDVMSAQDAFLAHNIPSRVRVHRVRGLSAKWARIPGFGTLGYRCAGATRKMLANLLTDADADTIVYFSTTQFPVHRIIPDIKARFGAPVVMDYQDMWVNDYYGRNPHIRPPGGRFKYALAHLLDVFFEQKTLRHVDAFTSVSAAYPEALRARYSFLTGKPFLVLPFGASADDFDSVRAAGTAQRHFIPGDGLQHWVYVGRGGADMARALRGFFSALRTARKADPALDLVRIHFLGTDYAHGAAARPSILPVAESEGVADLVTETPGRLPYSETLRCLLDADALIIPGSDDPGYTASKIYPCLLAKKPLLAIFHESSSVVTVLKETQAGCCVTFSAETSDETLSAEIARRWFDARAYRRMPETDWSSFAPYTASAMTHRLSALLESVLDRRQTGQTA